MCEVEIKEKQEPGKIDKPGKGDFQITVNKDDKEPIPEIQLTWNMPAKDIAKIQRKMISAKESLKKLRNARERLQIGIICMMACCIGII